MGTIEIRLRYGRSGELCHGHLRVIGSEPLNDLNFEDYTYSRMMSYLARVIRLHESVEVVLERIELEGSTYRLDAETVQQLREDPAAVISTMSQPARTVIVRDKQSPAHIGLLRVGHDTVAAALGDNVYLAVDAGNFECLGCGRWSACLMPLSVACVSGTCGLRLQGTLHGTHWFSVKTDDVLLAALPRYYIPRDWNPNKGWIGHVEFEQMYRTFKQERDKCYQQVAHKA